MQKWSAAASTVTETWSEDHPCSDCGVLVQRYRGSRLPQGMTVNSGTRFERHRCRPEDRGYRIESCPECQVTVRLLLGVPKPLGARYIEYGSSAHHKCDPAELARRMADPSWGPIGSLSRTSHRSDTPATTKPRPNRSQRQAGNRIRTAQVISAKPEERL